MKKVLLISPPFERFMGFSRFYYHIGLTMLAAVIERDGHEVLIYDADYDPDADMLSSEELMENHHLYNDALKDYGHPVWKEIERVIRDYSPDIIGITVLSMTYPVTEKLVSLIRDICPGVLIFSGGPHATLCPEELEAITDVVITHEGERVIGDVICGRIKKGIVKGKRVGDLDTLPYPAIHRLYRLDKYTKRDLSIVISSRGCPSSCKFCSSYELWGSKLVQKSPSYFLAELKHLVDDYGIRDFFITDDSFTCSKKWLREFLDGIKSLDVTWRCFSKIDTLDEDSVLQMLDAGCRNIKLGIESGSQRILDMIDKEITVEQILSADAMLKRMKAKWSAYFIIGFPGETVEDIRETQKLIQTLSASSITVNLYTPLPKNRLIEDDQDIDYTQYSFHSPNNNFTGCIDNETFSGLVQETLLMAKREYNEHIINS